MNAPYRLHYAPDNASLIVRLTMDELEIPFETVLVNRREKEQKGAEFRQLNPNGLIPALETPHGTMFETGAILLWLADHHGKMAPLPSAPGRCDFLKWLFFTSNTLHAEMRLLFYPSQYVGENAAAQEQLSRQVRQNLARRLQLLDDQAATEPDWLGAENPSVLDYYICAALRWLQLYPKTIAGWLSLRDYPRLCDLASRYENRPAVRRAISAEGLGETPFTSPVHPSPPEGSAL